MDIHVTEYSWTYMSQCTPGHTCHSILMGMLVTVSSWAFMAQCTPRHACHMELLEELCGLGSVAHSVLLSLN